MQKSWNIVLFASFSFCFVVLGAEQELMPLRNTNPDSVVIHIQKDVDFRPDRKKFLDIVDNLIPLPRSVNNIVFEYIRRKRDYDGEEQARQLQKAFRGLKISQRLGIPTFLGGATELIFTFYNSLSHKPLVNSATNWWEVPLLTTLFGVSTIVSCLDCCRNLKARKAYEVGKCGSRFLCGLVLMSAMGALLVDFAGTGSGWEYIFLGIGGTFGTFHQLSLLRKLSKTEKQFQFLELKKHLREELYVPK